MYNNGETATRNGAELGLAPTSGTVGKDLEIDISGNYVLDATNTFGIAYGTTRPGTDGKYTVKDVWTVEIKAADPAQLTYVVDPTNEKICVHEANILNIPVVSLVDTNCDPSGVDIVIPGNDDAIRSVKLIASAIADAVIEAREGVSMKKDDEANSEEDVDLESLLEQAKPSVADAEAGEEVKKPARKPKKKAPVKKEKAEEKTAEAKEEKAEETVSE